MDAPSFTTRLTKPTRAADIRRSTGSRPSTPPPESAPRLLRCWLLGLFTGLSVLYLDVHAHPDLDIGPLYSLVIVVLSLGGNALTIVAGTILTQALMVLGTCMWPPGIDWANHAPTLGVSAGFICLVAGLLLHRLGIEARLQQAYRDREAAWTEVKVLRGLLRMCAWCKRIDDSGRGWVPVDTYIARHSEADFTHGICPECAAAQGAELSPDSPG